ncbi:DUF1501 domain-containing protein [Tenacibaculum sp. M341]|uniref:DUF1501 domain-containing protein n=1 Tax=Tenacibaculum sp. M341 TaxID=2530339 RepID=UPI001048FEFE|nr:DUF1501 domain-containing protein [Tenacibaculum sp. M341]TCI92302.1 DUF1501 domain-containing protein [Tenacibaculum sp. M341]
MKRRNFIKRTSLATGGMFLAPQFLKALETNSIKGFNGKKLIIIQLKGGNDGLNTVVSFRNDLYYQNRQQIAISKNELLNLNDEVGFHPSLKPLKNLYDKGYLSIINNVGYPNPNRSHFRSTDIWQTASNSDEFLQTGWIGRYLDINKAQSYKAIEVDESLSLMLKGESQNGLAITNPNLFYKLLKQPFFDKLLQAKNTHLDEHNLGYLYNTMINARSSANYIYEKSKTTSSKANYPKNIFGKQLKTISEFITSGLETEVYYAALSGFDTHANQQNRQAKLLETYAESMNVFVNDLQNNNALDDTLIFTFSEFGRRVKQNGSRGTDHGTANNVFIIGKNLKKAGLYNPLPNLQNLDSNGDLKFTIDFREVYATILDKWLQIDNAKILNNQFSTLNFI